MDKNQLKPILEALLFVATEPLSVSDFKKYIRVSKAEDEVVSEEMTEEITEALPENFEMSSDAFNSDQEVSATSQLEAMQEKLSQELSKADILEALTELQADYADNPARGIALVAVAKGYQFRTKEEMLPYVRNLSKHPKPRLSPSSLETLSIVAYQQPVSRAKVEEIRGVDCGGVLKTLLEKDLLRMVGRSEEAGRPILYGTTDLFLETFGLDSLSALPNLRDLEASMASASLANEELDPEATQAVEEEVEEAFLSLDQESSELMSELESSLEKLGSLEKDIFSEEKKV